MHKDVVIIVDDDLTILELLRFQITDTLGSACDIELATSASEAGELLAQLVHQNRVVKVLVTDYFLDDGTGIDIIKNVKTYFPDCSTVLLTGQHQRDIEKVVDTAVVPDRYFSKPWNSFELKSHLNNLLNTLNH